MNYCRSLERLPVMKSNARRSLFTSIHMLATLIALGILNPLAALTLGLKRESRYFYKELLLPALPRVHNLDLTVAIANHPSLLGNDDLPVLYTNDPMKVSGWLADHIPSDGCTLGFDVEVRCALSPPLF